MELPRDVLGIVYRYIFDYRYRRLQLEYKRKWLDYELDHELDYDIDPRYSWDDNSCMFVEYVPYAPFPPLRTANWRPLGEGFERDSYPVGWFAGYKVIYMGRSHQLPKNY